VEQLSASAALHATHEEPALPQLESERGMLHEAPAQQPIGQLTALHAPPLHAPTVHI